MTSTEAAAIYQSVKSTFEADEFGFYVETFINE